MSMRAPSWRSMLGSAAVITAAVAAVTVGQALSGGDTGPPGPRTATLDGAYASTAVATALGSRDATSVSRAANRSAAPPAAGTKPATQAELRRVERRRAKEFRLLRRAANDAEKYAKRLSSREWVYPTTSFRLTEMFGVPGPYWQSGYHTGIDLATAYGTPVVAVGNGTVVRTGWAGPYGNQIRLQLPSGDEVWYNHLSSIEVTAGQPVLKGQALGRVGDTGNAFGYHLHFEYRLARDLSQAVDPVPFFVAHGLPLG